MFIKMNIMLPAILISGVKVGVPEMIFTMNNIMNEIAILMIANCKC